MNYLEIKTEHLKRLGKMYQKHIDSLEKHFYRKKLAEHRRKMKKRRVYFWLVVISYLLLCVPFWI